MKHNNLIQFIFYTVMCILGAFIVMQVCMLVQIRYLLPAMLVVSVIWSVLEVLIGEFIFKE